MLLALVNVGLLGYVRYTAWRAIPPAICIAVFAPQGIASLFSPTVAMAATAGVVALSPQLLFRIAAGGGGAGGGGAVAAGAVNLDRVGVRISFGAMVEVVRERVMNIA